MTDREAIDVLFNEWKCIDRNDGIHCDRKCESCDLVMDVGIIREAFNMAISALQAQELNDALKKAVERIKDLSSAQPEPCGDAVSRVDVLECFSDLYDTFEDCSKGIVNELHRKFEDLRTLPSVTPKQRTGEWIDDKCSLCGQYVYYGDMRNFCPNCGAKMNGGDQDDKGK